MNSPEVNIATRSRVIRRRNVKAILEKSNMELLTLIALAWGTGKVSVPTYGSMVHSSGEGEIPQALAPWIDHDDIAN